MCSVQKKDMKKICTLVAQKRIPIITVKAKTCLSQSLLREILNEFAGVHGEFERFAITRTHNQNVNHMFDTIQEALNGLPQQLWSVPALDPENEYFRALQLSSLTGEIYSYFKPPLFPPFDTSLLGVEQLNGAIQQNVQSVKDFLFVGVFSPSRFDAAIRNIDKRRTVRHRSFGFIINQVDGEKGAHWVCLICHVNEPEYEYEYFDPMNHQPNKLQKVFIKKVLKALGGQRAAWERVGRDESVKHQRGGVQCGMFCIHFIIQRMVEGVSVEDFHANPSTDEEMADLRYDFFREAEPELIELGREEERFLQQLEREEKNAKKKKPKKPKTNDNKVKSPPKPRKKIESIVYDDNDDETDTEVFFK